MKLKNFIGEKPKTFKLFTVEITVVHHINYKDEVFPTEETSQNILKFCSHNTYQLLKPVFAWKSFCGLEYNAQTKPAESESPKIWLSNVYFKPILPWFWGNQFLSWGTTDPRADV